ncbi:MAG: hypothetical protein ACYDCH_13395 [Gaiellaceae bacterium]
MLDATIMTFRAGSEHWNEYLVDDGTVIKLKLVVTEIVKVDDEYDPRTGDPLYVVNSTNVVSVQAPEQLKHQGGE